MNPTFDRMAKEHAVEVMDIFNYYIENGFAAYPESKLPYEFYGAFLEMTKNHPAFRETAEITCFLEKGETGKGTGREALRVIEEEGRKLGIKKLLAGISSENGGSIRFHGRNGFTECGRFRGIGKKRGKLFDVVWMQKDLA